MDQRGYFNLMREMVAKGYVDHTVESLGDWLEKNPTLDRLDFSDREMPGYAFEALCDILHANTTIKKLDLAFCGIEDSDAIALARILEVNKTIEAIDLGYNHIGDEGVVALAKALHTNQTLSSLCMYENRMGRDGVIALAEMLEINTTLKSLRVMDNKYICENELTTLINALQKNTGLEMIDIGHNTLNDRCAVALANALAINNTLKELVLFGGCMTKTGWGLLIQALEKNTTIVRLDFDADEETHTKIDELLNRNQVWASGEVDTKPAMSGLSRI